MTARKALLGALFLGTGAFLSPISAQPIDAPPQGPGPLTGMYAGLRGSYAFVGNATTTWAPTTPMTQLRGSYGAGGGGSVFVGTRLPYNLRLEVEGLYRYQPLSRVTLNGVSAGPVSGSSQMAAPMMNLLWDIPMPAESPIQPFVGMGVGAAYTETRATGSGNTYMSQNRWDPAYSFMAGFALPIDESSRLTAMYRWMQVRDARHKCATSGLVQSVCLNNSVNSTAVDIGYEMDL
jgi:opacity protein-like surface antigen